MEMTTQRDAAGPVALPIDDLLDEFEKSPVEVHDPGKVEVAATADAVDDQPKAEDDKPKKTARPKNDPVAKLQREVEEARQREAQERQQREQYARFAAQKAREAQAAMARAQTSDYDLIANALDGATDKMAGLEQQYAAAFAEGDGTKAAAIQKQMAILGARITQLEDGKARLEQQAQLQRQRAQAQARQAQQQPRQQPQQHADPFEASIAHFTPESKAWLRNNREYATPDKWNEVLAAHFHATGKLKLNADTPEYFEAIEKELGLRDGEDGDDVKVVTQKPRRSIPAAPVSRDSAIGGVDVKNRKVELSALERQTAADLGMSDKEYAAYKMKALKDGRYDNH